jgi:hypothetical protein
MDFCGEVIKKDKQRQRPLLGGESFTFPPIAVRLRWMGHTVVGAG